MEIQLEDFFASVGLVFRASQFAQQNAWACQLIQIIRAAEKAGRERIQLSSQLSANIKNKTKF